MYPAGQKWGASYPKLALQDMSQFLTGYPIAAAANGPDRILDPRLREQGTEDAGYSSQVVPCEAAMGGTSDGLQTPSLECVGASVPPDVVICT